MPVIALSNQKGGVGKTTSTLNLGAALQRLGKRVLLVDLDPQGNLSVAAGITSPEALSPSIGELITQAARTGGPAPDAASAIVRSPAGVDLIPANSQLSAAELALVSAIGRESTLDGLLTPLRRDYDVILMDCLPSLSLLVVNAFTAADGVIIPVQADYLAMQGLAQVMETIGAVQRRLNPRLQVLGILLTMVDQRTSHSREVVATIREAFAGQIRVFNAEIRMQVGLKDSSKAGLSIQDYDPNSSGALAYNRLAEEVREAIDALGPAPAPYHKAASSSALVLPALAPPTDDQATVQLQRANALDEKRASSIFARQPASRGEPLRFAEFLVGREAWLGNGD